MADPLLRPLRRVLHHRDPQGPDLPGPAAYQQKRQATGQLPDHPGWVRTREAGHPGPERAHHGRRSRLPPDYGEMAEGHPPQRQLHDV